MTKIAVSCPYCGLEDSRTKGPKCQLCGMNVGNEYIMYIDANNKIVNFCSINCMDLFEESRDMEGE